MLAGPHGIGHHSAGYRFTSRADVQAPAALTPARDDLQARRLTVGSHLLTQRSAEVSGLMRVSARPRLQSERAEAPGGRHAICRGGRSADDRSPAHTHPASHAQDPRRFRSSVPRVRRTLSRSASGAPAVDWRGWCSGIASNAAIVIASSDQKCPLTASAEIRRVSSGAGRRIRISAGTRWSSHLKSS
jgi:hypothetical protein